MFTEQAKLYGYYFGYPECCIKEFIEAGLPDNSPNREIKVKAGKGTGFIPCYSHAIKILNGEIYLEDLIVNRKSLYKFPKTDPFKIEYPHFLQFVDNLQTVSKENIK